MNKKLKMGLLGTLIVGSTLAVTLPIISCSSTTSSDIQLTVDNDNMTNVKEIITNSLTEKMQVDNITRADQVKLATSWSVNSELPKDVVDSIKDILKFKDGSNEVTYATAVKSINFNKSAIIGEFGEEIIGPELKVIFNNGYTGNVLIQVGSLGDVAVNDVIPVDNDLDIATTAIKNILTTEMDSKPNYNDQVQLGISWSIGSELNEEWLNEVKSKLNFVDANGEVFNGSDAIKSMTFITETDVPINSGIIVGPKLKVNLNNGYISNQDIIIDSGSLGNAKNGTRSLSVSSEDQTLFETKLKEAFKARIDGFATFNQQKNYLDNLNANSSGPGVDIDASIVSQVIPHIKFTDNFGKEVLGINSIDRIFLISEFQFSGSGSEVTGGKFVLIMKPGYTHSVLINFEIQGVITTLK